MTVSQTDTPYWSRPAADLAADLGTGLEGLSGAEAAGRLATVGPNAVDRSAGPGAAQLFLRQFANPLVLILLFAAALSLGLREWLDATIIAAIVLGSSLLSFLQEYRAATAVAALARRLALGCRVLRDGAECAVPLRAVVPGDIVVLSAGNLVPADGIVIAAQDFLVSEASITGESFPVEKRPGLSPADAPVTSRSNAVFFGSSVRSGTARVLVLRTGGKTEFGTIAARLHTRPEETDFSRGVRRFGTLLIRVMVLMVLFVLTVNLLLDRPVIASLLFAVALAVGLSPELLPAIVSVTLSAGARRMGRRGVIVRRLDSIESLGSMDILCTDKTGTLTQGVIVLQDAVDPDGQPSPDVLQLAYLNAALETGIANPLDAALVAAGEAAALTVGDTQKFDEIPFDFERRRLTIVTGTEAGRRMITKGAFANVVACCDRVATADGSAPLDAARRSGFEELVAAKGAAGLRVLAVATREVAPKPDYTRDDETGMTLRGFLMFEDPPKPDAARVVADLARLGIATKIISGDSRHVTAHLAAAVGLDPASILTGTELESMRDEAVWHLAPQTDLFAEIGPQQKERIVRALQRTGHVVGYMGDGINDAPALHAADVGISVEGAVDVARESADFVLLRPDLGVLRRGVEDGRKTFANTLKYISITVSANFGNMLSMALAAPALPFLPLAAKQILLNNFLSDFPSVAISADNVDAGQIERPQRWDVGGIRRFMVVFGLVSSAFDLLTFAMLLLVFRAGEAGFQTAWFVVSLMTELLVVLLLRTRGPFWRSRPSALLLWSTLAVSGLALAVPFLGEASRAFGFIPLEPAELAGIVAIVLAYGAVTEAAKVWFYRKEKGPRRAP